MLFTHVRMLLRPGVIFWLASIVGSFTPKSAAAFEMYVLNPELIEAAQRTPNFSLWETLLSNLEAFLFFGVGAAVLLGVVFAVSIAGPVERALDPYLAVLRPYAPLVCRVSAGMSFLFAAWFQALHGPELPLTLTYGIEIAPYLTILLAIVGTMLLIGYYARIAALCGLIFFLVEVIAHGSYMLLYANYAGELLLLSIIGAHIFAVHQHIDDVRTTPAWFIRLKVLLAPYAFLLLRILFGVSLIYAAMYTKVWYNQIALAAVSLPLTGHENSLAESVGLAPEFLVLGMLVVEVLLGVFFILGVEIRFTSLFLIVWFLLSLSYFGLAVWPQLVLIGVPLAFICYGYDRTSIEGYFLKHDTSEPVL